MKLTDLLPYRRLQFASKLPADKVATAIDRLMDNSFSFGVFRDPNKPYRGTVEANTFKLNTNRSSFGDNICTVAQGSFFEEEKGNTSIEVTVRFSFIGMLIFVACLLLFIPITYWLFTGIHIALNWLVLLLPSAGYIGLMVFYWLELSDLKYNFRIFLKATEQPNS